MMIITGEFIQLVIRGPYHELNNSNVTYTIYNLILDADCKLYFYCCCGAFLLIE